MQPMRPKMKPDADDRAEVTYRWLEMPELMLIDPTIEAMGWCKLNELTSRVIVAEADGKIIAFEVFQFFPMVGPIHIEKEYRGKGIAEELSNRMLAFLRECDCRGFEVSAESAFVERICEANGMELVKSPVYRWKQELAMRQGD
jgi:GNAT superfamily N-acetyltransferase